MFIEILPRVRKFIDRLDVNFQGETLDLFELLERDGHNIQMPHSKPLGNKLFELRGRHLCQIRYFYTFKDGLAIVLHGYIKKSQKIPQAELRLARKRLANLT